jgi:hypothetical protein
MVPYNNRVPQTLPRMSRLEAVFSEVRETQLTFYTSVPRKEKSVSLGTLWITRYHKQRHDAHNHHELEHAL